jgi:hypothetical protein
VIGSAETCLGLKITRVQMKLLRRGRYCAPIAERKGKSAGGEIHLEDDDTRLREAPQPGLSTCEKDSGKSTKNRE